MQLTLFFVIDCPEGMSQLERLFDSFRCWYGCSFSAFCNENFRKDKNVWDKYIRVFLAGAHILLSPPHIHTKGCGFLLTIAQNVAPRSAVSRPHQTKIGRTFPKASSPPGLL